MEHHLNVKKKTFGGIALMLLVVLGMMATIAGATVLFVNRQYNATVEQEQEERAFHAAEAGVNLVVFGLNEAIYNMEVLIVNEILEGELVGVGTYTLNFAAVEGAQPGQQIRVLSKGYDSTGRFCQAVEVRIHRTDDAKQQFLVDFWNHLPSCDSISSEGSVPPGPGGSPLPSSSATPPGGGSPTPPPEECVDDGDCPAGVCNPTTNYCETSCSNDSQCPSGSCNTTAGTCDQSCTSDSECQTTAACATIPGGRGCLCNTLTNTCPRGCNDNSDCPSGYSCFDGQCLGDTCTDFTPECEDFVFTTECQEAQFPGGSCYYYTNTTDRELFPDLQGICPNSEIYTCRVVDFIPEQFPCNCPGDSGTAATPYPDPDPDMSDPPEVTPIPDPDPDMSTPPEPTVPIGDPVESNPPEPSQAP